MLATMAYIGRSRSGSPGNAAVRKSIFPDAHRRRRHMTLVRGSAGCGSSGDFLSDRVPVSTWRPVPRLARVNDLSPGSALRRTEDIDYAQDIEEDQVAATHDFGDR